MAKRLINPKYQGGIGDQLYAASNLLGRQTTKKIKALASRIAKKYPYEHDRYYLYHDIVEIVKQRLDDVY